MKPRPRATKAMRAAATPAIRPFSRSLPLQLLRAREHVMEHFRPHLRAHGVTDQQWRVIRALAEVTDADMNQLSVLCCISPPSLSRIVPRLEQAGLLRSVRGDDLRRVVVSLTDSGQELFATMAAESVEIYASVMALVGEKRLEELYNCLDDLIRALRPGVSEAAE